VVGVVAALLLIGAALALGPGAAGWQTGEPLPTPRSEVAAAVVGGGIAIVGGFLADGSSSREVDLYSPTDDRWTRLPDLPVGVNHTMAAATGGELYVAGGFGLVPGGRLRAAFVLEGGRWRALPPLPAVRAAGGAAVVGGKLYVVGGLGPAGLARQSFVLDLRSRRWSAIPGPTPRQHLAVTAWGGRIYAVAGRRFGYDTNLRVFESYSPAAGRWRRLPPVPNARGGTGAAVVDGVLVSVGGEEPAGTIASVYGFDLTRSRWRQLPSLPTPRHGLGVAAARGRVYAIGGGPEPGLTVSAANESLP
jgi:non-specific serine/threonine protein kinase